MEAATRLYKLKQDLFVLRPQEIDPYTYYTRADLERLIHHEHVAGQIYEWDQENGGMHNPEYGTVGIDPGDPDPNWWESYDPTKGEEANDQQQENGRRIGYLEPHPIDSDGGHCD
jgi:hypothetical protein